MRSQQKNNEEEFFDQDEFDRKKRLIEKRKNDFREKLDPGCAYCELTGMMNAIEKSTHAIYAFRCTFCDTADQIGPGPKFPGWNFELNEKFQIMRSNEVASEVLKKMAPLIKKARQMPDQTPPMPF